jgi:hypothetical protein
MGVAKVGGGGGGGRRGDGGDRVVLPQGDSESGPLLAICASNATGIRSFRSEGQVLETRFH